MPLIISNIQSALNLSITSTAIEEKKLAAVFTPSKKVNERKPFRGLTQKCTQKKVKILTKKKKVPISF